MCKKTNYFVTSDGTKHSFNNRKHLDFNDLCKCDTYFLDIVELNVDKCTKLETLNINDNMLKCIDLSKCVNLTHLYIYGNELTEFDLSHNIKLKKLYCSSNKIDELDLSNNKELFLVYCRDNDMKELMLPESIQHLYCDGNRISSISLHKSIQRIDLDASTKITSKANIDVFKRGYDLNINFIVNE